MIDGHPAECLASSTGNSPAPSARSLKGESEPFDITIETPNLFALRKRVEAQTIAFETILQEYRSGGGGS